MILKRNSPGFLSDRVGFNFYVQTFQLPSLTSQKVKNNGGAYVVI